MQNPIRKVCDWCIKMNRPNECIVLVSKNGRRRACGYCNKAKKRCSLVGDGKQSRTPSATPPARPRSSSRPRTPQSKPKATTPNSTKKGTTSKANSTKAGPSRSSSQAAKSRVPNTMSKYILSLHMYRSSFSLIIAAPTIAIPPFKPLISTSASRVAEAELKPIIELAQRDIQALQDRLENTERFLGQLVSGIKKQLKQDSSAVPAWLIPLLDPPANSPTVPRIDDTSGHTIGRAIYSPQSQQPKTIVSKHFSIKMEDDDEWDQSE
jgi:hypothetical protein